MAYSTENDARIRRIQGESVPTLGFGTWDLLGEEGERAIATALEVGYRQIDTARAYENEAEVGRAIAAGGVPREELFVTSKIWPGRHDPDAVRREVDASLRELRVDYLDLMLIHWPDKEQRIEPTLDTLFHLTQEGKLRHLGISNFNVPLFEIALAVAPVFALQVEYHCFLDQDRLRHLALNKDVLFTAYRPLADGLAGRDETLRRIAQKHGKSPEQVALRWLVEQEGVSPIPRSRNPEHIRSNFEIFDFQLDEEDTLAINRLPKDRRTLDSSLAPDWNA